MANCAGCVHYVPFEGDIGGECTQVVGAPIKGALAHVECTGDCSCDSVTLVVMPDFGCVHFEPRERLHCRFAPHGVRERAMMNCAGCVHYAEISANGGRCAVIADSVGGYDSHCDYSVDARATLVVGPDFGCVHFEPRDKPVDVVQGRNA